MKSLVLAAACLALALLTYFQFPGHTWLQQDSQIYAPILEHLHDESVLSNDILASEPHVAYTVYDETALALRSLTGLSFQTILAAEQIAARAFGIWGLYLIALVLLGRAEGEGAPGASGRGPLAFFIAVLCSLGASVAGAHGMTLVMALEYEPTPRAFAFPLVLCAIGLAAKRRYVAAGIAGGAAFLYHPPTALPFWLFYAPLAFWPAKSETVRRRLGGLAPMAVSAVLLTAAAILQQGGGEAQSFFSRLSPELEGLQRLRGSYNWISMDDFWAPGVIANQCILFGLFLAAAARLRRWMPFELRLFALGCALLGILSMPASWLLLDHLRWALMSQFQPMRYLLFVTLFAQLFAAAAGGRAALGGRHLEAVAWFAAAYVVTVQPLVAAPFALRRVAVIAGLALVAWAAVRLSERFPSAHRAPLALGLAAFFAIPALGDVVNYTNPNTPELRQLSNWAFSSTPRDSVFLFADARKANYPGIFRTEALRAVYVDWKGGGQVNYLAGFAAEWQSRWEQAGELRFRRGDVSKFGALGVRYVVLQAKNRVAGRKPVYENGQYVVYEIARPEPRK